MSGIPPGVTLLAADAPGLSAVFPPQWGIFGQDGTPFIMADSVGEVEYNREYNISDYPQEQGAFESYNKVQIPFDAKVTFLSSRTRQALLPMMESLVYQLTLVTVVTPEVSYPSANLVRYGLRRTSRNGVSLVAIDVWCKEIRYTATTQVAGTNQPIGTTNGGSNLAPGSSSGATEFQGAPGPIGPLNNGQPAAINTGSTNAATPTQSGPVAPVTPPSAPNPPAPPEYPILPGPL